MNDPFDAAALHGLPFTTSLELHDELGSTNDRAKELVAERVAPPALVIADRQTAGRGRGANRWHAETGSLTFSLLIDPSAYGWPTEQQGLLAVAAGLAVIDAAREAAGVAARLKWPNDVLLNGKKLAGVLIEAPRPGRWVVGVGVNVGVSFENAPPEVAARATSLSEEADRQVSRQATCEAFLAAFRAWLSPTGRDGLIDTARSLCVLTGRRLVIRDGERSIEGLCSGWADDGALLIQTASGETRVRSGSVARSE